ncbi:MAG: hypothetical protein BWY63_03079 [Chloroflexi bacterium ADurb.Bin360]|nr:MAG: hypothetical protein BWY63_03079 [Chloroflexi bacterium ADurb.Bin360]
MYARSTGNAGTQPHARIGLDPQGTQITSDHVHNDILSWPPYLQWSSEQTNLFTWEQLKVTAEPLGTRLMAMTYAHPSYEGPLTPWFDTWWDNGALHQLSFPDGKLPAPSSWDPNDNIQNVSYVPQGDQLVVSWNTPMPASTQVWYDFETPGEAITTTLPFTYTNYLPLVSKTTVPRATTLNLQPTTNHTASIPLSSMESGTRITLWVLSRRPGTEACITEGRGPFEYILP